MTRTFRKRILAACFFIIFFSAVSGYAFLFEVPVLDAGQITKLSDADLTEKYIDVSVELEAVQTFYENSAFTPTEYRKYKNLLKYRILLLQELGKRKIDPLRTHP